MSLDEREEVEFGVGVLHLPHGEFTPSREPAGGLDGRDDCPVFGYHVELVVGRLTIPACAYRKFELLEPVSRESAR